MASTSATRGHRKIKICSRRRSETRSCTHEKRTVSHRCHTNRTTPVHTHSLRLEPNQIQLVEFVDGEFVSFDSFWRTLHQSSKPSEPPKPAPSAPINRLATSQRFPPTTTTEAPVRHLQPHLPGIGGYGSGSEYSQASAMMPRASAMKKSSGVTIPPPPAIGRQPMQFISAGFKQPAEYGHLTPGEQLAQLQLQEGHRIQPTGGYSVNKHFRPPQL